MALKIFSSFRSIINNVSKNIINFPKWIYNQIYNIINHFAKIRNNFKDMTKTNLDLGKYHFYNNNLADAIFRFKLVYKFFDPGNKQACYYLGWCYMLKSDINQAMEFIAKAGDADEVNLRQFLRTIDITKDIPATIEKINRNRMAEDYAEQFVSKEHYLPTEIINEINRNILEVPEKYNVLELGSNIGICGIEMRKRLPEEFTLTGVENSEMMLSILQQIDTYNNYNNVGDDILMLENAPQEQNYNQLINDSVVSFLEQNKQQYDLIVSLNGLAFTLNLDKLFALIKKTLTTKGVFVFALKAVTEEQLNKADNQQKQIVKESLEFLYSDTQIHQALRNNYYQILFEQKLALAKNNSFYIFIVKPSK